MLDRGALGAMPIQQFDSRHCPGEDSWDLTFYLDLLFTFNLNLNEHFGKKVLSEAAISEEAAAPSEITRGDGPTKEEQPI